MVFLLWTFGLALLASVVASPPQPPHHGGSKLPTSFRWRSTNPLVSPKDDHRDFAAIKDPTVVHHKGVYHVFATTARSEGYNMVYMNFTDWSKAQDAHFAYLDEVSAIGPEYRAAPQVFYFAPQKLWYLAYQGTWNGSDNGLYSTNPDIGNPAGWSAPKAFYKEMPQIIKDHIDYGYWVDMWVICDKVKCHLFSSDDMGQLYRSETSIKDFPNNFNEPVIALQDPNRWHLFEASCVYKIKGSDEYLLLVEAIGLYDERRWFRSWTSKSIEGPWKPLADEFEHPFARANNVVFPEGAKPWTVDISHGEMVRYGKLDQTLELDPCKMEFLYQGMPPEALGGEYTSLPWSLALLTPEKKPAGCRR